MNETHQDEEEEDVDSNRSRSRRRGADNFQYIPPSDPIPPVYDDTGSNSQADEQHSNDSTETGRGVVANESQTMDCLFDICNKCESERQMHRLAQEYYQFRENLFHFIPVTVLTMASGILAFMATSSTFESQTENFTLWVGILSIVSAAFQSFARNAKYAARGEMHRTAALEMKKLKDGVEFSQIDPEHGLVKKGTHSSSVGGEESEEGIDQSPSTMTQQVQAYRATFSQVLASCDSTIPSPVTQAFLLVDTRLTLQDCQDFKDKGTVSLAVYNELFSEFSNTIMWPLIPLKPHYAVNRAIDKVNHQMSSKGSKLPQFRTDMDEGVVTLLLWIFGCDSTSWIWACCQRKRRPVLREKIRRDGHDEDCR